ncbi:MAG: ribosome-associated protein [Halieaceae bacterium]|jgi:ribosome-associated protein
MAEHREKVISVRGQTRLWLSDCVFEATRSSGPGGQNVNKVATAVQLRYDLHSAQLPDAVRARLLASGDRRISDDGVLVIKAQRHRTQGRNRDDAIDRLLELLGDAAVEPRRRIATRPTRGSRERRLKGKEKNSKNKQLRKKPQVE